MSTARVMVAEAIGTFFLCFAGIAAILSTQAPINSGGGIVGIALAHGLALSIAVNAFGGISGAHLQPGRDARLSRRGPHHAAARVQYILASSPGRAGGVACVCVFPVRGGQ